MNWALTLLLCIVMVEMLLRMPLLPSLTAIVRTSERSMRLLRASGVSDHWKEKAMGAYARRTFLASVTLAGLIMIVAALAALLVLLFDQVSETFGAFVLSPTGLVVSLLTGTLYVVLRRKFLHG